MKFCVKATPAQFRHWVPLHATSELPGCPTISPTWGRCHWVDKTASDSNGETLADRLVSASSNGEICCGNSSKAVVVRRHRRRTLTPISQPEQSWRFATSDTCWRVQLVSHSTSDYCAVYWIFKLVDFHFSRSFYSLFLLFGSVRAADDAVCCSASNRAVQFPVVLYRIR